MNAQIARILNVTGFANVTGWNAVIFKPIKL
jgi:hypothetical protein